MALAATSKIEEGLKEGLEKGREEGKHAMAIQMRRRCWICWTMPAKQA